jgi:hypothetical protein
MTQAGMGSLMKGAFSTTATIYLVQLLRGWTPKRTLRVHTATVLNNSPASNWLFLRRSPWDKCPGLKPEG